MLLLIPEYRRYVTSEVEQKNLDALERIGKLCQKKTKIIKIGDKYALVYTEGYYGYKKHKFPSKTTLEWIDSPCEWLDEYECKSNTRIIICVKCGVERETTIHNTKYCLECAEIARIESNKAAKIRYEEKRKLTLCK